MPVTIDKAHVILPSEREVKVMRSEDAGVTTVTTLIDYGSKEARDGAMASGMTDGMEQSYQLLDGLLREQGA